MGFLAELGKSFLTYIALVGCGALGIWAGISFRKHKNKKNTTENAEIS